jgi:transcriptional regulator of acetoin/glycerol metabolism
VHHRRGKAKPIDPGTHTRVREVLAQAERLIESLVRELGHPRRGIVALPPEGYPLKLLERDALVQALEMAGWVQSGAAELLGISARVMNHKIRRHGIRVPPRVRARVWKD